MESSSSSSSSKPELLCRVDFPLYQAVVVSPRHILLAGGGGAAKTGVGNGFEIFEIIYDGEAKTCVGESILRHDTGDCAVMNVSAGNFDPVKQATLIAMGQNERCETFALKLARRPPPPPKEDPSSSKDEGGEGLRHRNKNGPIRKNANSLNPLTFNVSALKTIQTDYNMSEPYQKVVRISPNEKFMATGGEDGMLRIWTFPECNRTHEIEAHEKEIDDIDFSPDNNKVVTISKDRRALVWDVKKGKKHAEMGWDAPETKIKYAYKRIRFGRIEGDSKRYKLFTIVNPVGTSKPLSYLQRWDTKAYVLEKAVSHEGSLSALAVSDNGIFVATGSMFDGTVDIYTTFNLKRLKRVEKSHSTFITGLEFLPTTAESEASRGFSEASVVSISVDHCVCIHHIPKLRSLSMFTASVIIILFLVAVFTLCSYFGL